MLGFRFDPLGPFWLEDLVFLVMDEVRQLPKRAAKATAQARRMALALRDFDPTEFWSARRRANDGVAATAAPAVQVIHETARLEEPEAWDLATEPLAAVGTGTASAVSLHKTAAEQLDALTYVLDQIRADVRPLMVNTRLKGEEIVQIPIRAEFETSLEALLALSRKNEATRPKRARSAA
jgi:hypothetical protein